MLKKIIACAAGLFIIAAAYGIFANNIDDETTVNGEHLGTQHVEVSDEISINTKTLKDYVSKTEKLITCEYYYSEIGDYEKSKPFLNFKLPFTTDKTLYTYSGKISSSEHEGVKRGVMIGAVFLYLCCVFRIKRSVSARDSAALTSRRLSGELRSMLTLPT